MQEYINEQVSVLTVYNRDQKLVMPRKVKWQGRDYIITKIGYYHKRKIGKTVFHVFDVTDGNMAFRLVCNSDNLHWLLEEVSDGITN